MVVDLIPRLGERTLFPELQATAYLNHAAIAPPALPVTQAVEQVMRDYARHGVSAFVRAEAERSLLRAELAALINAESEELGLGINTSRGVSDIALSIPWKAGDRVLCFRGEFPANVTPWQRAAELFSLDLVFHEVEGFATGAGLSDLERALKAGVRLVAVSAVQFQTGRMMPIAAMSELCHRYGAELFVDAIQACGAVPLDVRALGIDYMSCGSHKWLCGFEGSGFVYVAKRLLSRLRPVTASWLSHEEPIRFLFEGEGHLRYDRPLRARADVFETGTPNVLGCAALKASVSLLRQLGIAEIYSHVNAYLDRLEPGLLERGFVSLRASSKQARSCILSVLPPAPASAVSLGQRLAQHGVIAGTPDGKLRFAPHFHNSIREIDHVLAAVDKCLAE